MPRYLFSFPFIVLLFITCLPAATLNYDSINRLTKADYGNGLVIQYSYDDNGNRTSRTVTDNGRTITVTVPSGGGSVSGAGGKLVGDTVTLRATPETGSQFDYWKENGSIVSYQNPLTFTVSVSRELEAYFSTIGSYDSVMARYSLDPETDGAPSADPDGDGMTNLVEYLLGGDPTKVDLQTFPYYSLTTLSDGESALVYEFDYSTEAATHVTFGVVYSSDLTTWTPAIDGQNGVTITTTAINEKTNHLRAVIPFANDKIFARIKVDL